MDGGPSQVDTFDPKPRLAKENGQPFKMKIEADAVQQQSATRWAAPGSSSTTAKAAFRSAICFRTCAACVDDLAIVRSMTSNFPSTPAPTTSCTPARPAGPAQHGGLDHLWPGQRVPGPARLRRAQRRPDSRRAGSTISPAAFCRPRYQGSMFKPEATPVANIRPPRSASRRCSRTSWPCCASSMRHASSGLGRPITLESAIANYELAYPNANGRAGADRLRRRDARPRKRLYGLDARFEPTRIFAPAVPAGPAAGRAGRAVHRTDLPEGRRRSLGPARQI